MASVSFFFKGKYLFSIFCKLELWHQTLLLASSAVDLNRQRSQTARVTPFFDVWVASGGWGRDCGKHDLLCKDENPLLNSYHSCRVISAIPVLWWREAGRLVGLISHQPSSLFGKRSCFREIKVNMMEQDVWHPILASTWAHKLAYINIPNVYHICYTGIQTDRHTCTHRYWKCLNSSSVWRIIPSHLECVVIGSFLLVGRFFKTGFLCGS